MIVERRKSQGFTLIEIFIGLAIIALLLLLGMPSFTSFMRNSEIRSTTESLVNGLRAASAEATRQNAHVMFTLAPSGSSSWAINTISNPASQTDCTTLVQPPIQSYAQNESGRNSTITTTPAARRTVCFNGLGRIINQGILPSDHLQQIDVASIVPGEARTLRIIVDDPAPPVSGKRGLRMCDPDPALAALVPPDPRAC